MKKTTRTKITVGVLASVMLATSFAGQANSLFKPHDFTSSIAAGYGSEGAQLGVQSAKQMSDSHGLVLAYEAKEDFDVHHFSGELINLDGGLGYHLSYEYGRHHLADGERSHETYLATFQRFALGSQWSITPDVGAGILTHSQASNNTFFAKVGAELTYQPTPEAWLSFTPSYAYGLNTMKYKDGSSDKLRDLDYQARIGFSFANNHSLEYSYTWADNDDNQSLISYRFSF
ncbi:hypothetical protein [Motilimonas pumila]|uniref:Porin family protein n=1 Tax=Motilimonas pumila TaxID=2303987 RepID=A0A418YBT3_9GAMM|nr:hypothetical protein [Motilimonas pumila]RJG41973.1 hypothetical protein D1Z90_15160 [Motilimonas pumila]